MIFLSNSISNKQTHTHTHKGKKINGRSILRHVRAKQMCVD